MFHLVRDKVAENLRRLEDFRETVYDCRTGKPAHTIPCEDGRRGRLTIGYGRNLEDNGVSRAEAERMLQNDIARNWSEAAALVQNFAGLGVERKAVLVEMVYQLGKAGVASFTRMRKAVNEQNWEAAAAEMLDSDWAREDTPERASELAKRMRNG